MRRRDKHSVLSRFEPRGLIGVASWPPHACCGPRPVCMWTYIIILIIAVHQAFSLPGYRTQDLLAMPTEYEKPSYSLSAGAWSE